MIHTFLFFLKNCILLLNLRMEKGGGDNDGGIFCV